MAGNDDGEDSLRKKLQGAADLMQWYPRNLFGLLVLHNLGKIGAKTIENFLKAATKTSADTLACVQGIVGVCVSKLEELTSTPEVASAT